MSAHITNLLSLTQPELEAFVKGLGEPAFRGRQLWQWIWAKGAADFQEMTNISKAFRQKLSEVATIDLPTVERVSSSTDGTFKLLLKLSDAERIECVLIPEKEHYTLCLSTQVGCAMACAFCSTGAMGFTRNMNFGEIAAQALLGRRFLASQGIETPLRNIVYMGMGEPLNNTHEVITSLRALAHPEGMDFSPRRITVSTAGLPKGLAELGKANQEAPLCSLAVSLHAPTQKLREQIMPRAAAAADLESLMAALDAYPLRPRQRITYEYVMLDGVNDTEREAKALVKLLAPRKAKINLIAYNPAEADVCGFRPTPLHRIEAFERQLRDSRLTVILRKSKGQDIAAACGQLKAASR